MSDRPAEPADPSVLPSARPGEPSAAADPGFDVPAQVLSAAEAQEQDGGAAQPAAAAGNGDRSEQRAETMRVLRRMADLPADDPERARLRAEVIEDHMAYARHVAQRYGGRGGSGEDFEQVAYLGLVKAVDNFDPGYGTGFLGYATPMIIGEIKRYFRDATWGVHVPRRMQELTGALRKATDTLTHDLGREPTIAELAERLGAEPEEIVEAIDAAGAYTTASLDHPVNTTDQAASLLDFMGEEDSRFEAVIDRQVLTQLLTKLGERDKKILLMRYFRGMTQAEIGAELGVSQMQISRLLTRILRELRAGFG
ncbi:MAG TPA: SigB/SigF/SigG family RNA polymerase sigma factor [Actinospica sp.]|nr:SigB/SigF/SigG family RNA polymerase sigma factor [Actinospica sp.]